MRLNISTNFPEIVQRISALGNQAAFASAVALTRTAKDVQEAINTAMPETAAFNEQLAKRVA